MVLEFLDFHVGNPRHTLLRSGEQAHIFAAPLSVKMNLLNRLSGHSCEQDVYICDLPLMTRKKTFVVNGIEKTVLSELVLSPGVYFYAPDTDGRQIYRASIVPDRGTRIDFEIDTNRRIWVRFEGTQKIPATVLVKAMGFSGQDWILELFKQHQSILETLKEDNTYSEEAALIEIYKLLKPDEIPTVKSACSLLETHFFTSMWYDLTDAGRYQLFKKLRHGVLYRFGREQSGRVEFDPYLKIDLPQERLFIRELTREDILATIRYLIGLTEGRGRVDDIHHLGNYRLRSVGEILQNKFRIGMAQVKSLARARMMAGENEVLTPQSLIDVRPVMTALKDFFAPEELPIESEKVNRLITATNQTNPLAELMQKRQFRSPVPERLWRERFRFRIEDRHYSLYGRLCPVETPVVADKGLVSSLTIYARINDFGLIETPYRAVDKASGRVTERIVYLTADEEENCVIAPADTELDSRGCFVDKKVACRYKGGIRMADIAEIDYLDVAVNQVLGVTSALIPFLEYNDPRRLLTNVHLQCEAVPLIKPEAPIVGTGLEGAVAYESGALVTARSGGIVARVTATEIEIRTDTGKIDGYRLTKFGRSNQGTCVNQRPIVFPGQQVEAGQVIGDGSCTDDGELALGRHVLVAFMPWDGYNHESAIVVGERVIKQDLFTSIHIKEYRSYVKDTTLGPEQITRKIPYVEDDALKNLDDRGVVQVGTRVRPGDILVGKVASKDEAGLIAEEQLLRAIFDKNASHFRDASLTLPIGRSGTVIDVDDGYELPVGVKQLVRVFVAEKRKLSVGDQMADRHGNTGVVTRIVPEDEMPFLPDGTPVDVVLNPLGTLCQMDVGGLMESHLAWAVKLLGHNIAVSAFGDNHRSKIASLLRKAGLPENGKMMLRDGRTGIFFDQPVAVGYLYLMKLNHMAADKIRARSVGPYSLITQQPTGDKGRFAGQYVGEKAVWALQAHGAAYTLREMMTLKSDDMAGRVETYEAIVKGNNLPEPEIPETVKMLVKNLKGVCLDIQILTSDGDQMEIDGVDKSFTETSDDFALDFRISDYRNEVLMGGDGVDQDEDLEFDDLVKDEEDFEG